MTEALDLSTQARVPALVEAPRLDGVTLAYVLGRLRHGIISVNHRFEVEYVNPAAAGLLSVGPELRVGALLPEPWPHFSLRKFAARLFGATAPLAQVVETPAGRLLGLDGMPALKSGSGVLVIEDVTTHERRRRAEADFVSNAAHELRTPLSGIASALDVLQGGAKEKPADRDLFLNHIQRESDRLTRLAHALLLLARIQSGGALPKLTIVEMRPLLLDVSAQLSPQPGVAVSVDCEPELAVLADYDLLRHAIWNVAANAATHTSRGSVAFSARSSAGAVEVEVRDTGRGMSRAEQERAFDRFYSGTSSKGGGFGIGLSIAQEVARALTGTIELESRPGSGTRVVFRLPAARVVRP